MKRIEAEKLQIGDPVIHIYSGDRAEVIAINPAGSGAITLKFEDGEDAWVCFQGMRSAYNLP